MPINIHSNSLIHLAEDIRFLAEHARCPQRQQSLLLDWSRQVQRHAEAAFREEMLLDVVDALVTLSHANAGFSWPAAPPFCRVEVTPDVEDHGGYFAGRHAVMTLIKLVPVSEDFRLKLVREVLSRVDRDLSGLEKMIPVK